MSTAPYRVAQLPADLPAVPSRRIVSGESVLVLSLVLWVVWLVLLVGTLIGLFDRLFYERDLGHGYALNFAFEYREGIFVSRNGSVLVPEDLRSGAIELVAVDDACVGGVVSDRSSERLSWFVLDKASGDTAWFSDKSAMQAHWQTASASAPQLLHPTSFRPPWFVLIVTGGVLAFLLSAFASLAGGVLLLRTDRQRATR